MLLQAKASESPLITLTSRVQRLIRQHAEQCYPYECVGLLLGSKDEQNVHIKQIYAAENAALASQAHFLLLPASYLQADRLARTQALEVVGIYHSHPDQPARLSNADLLGLQETGTGYLYCIQSVYAGQATELCAWILQDALEIVSCDYVLNTEPG